MSLVRLVYVSRLAKGCGPEDLEKILAISRRNNKAAGVTGALCYSAKGFMQCLEGPAQAVNQLYRVIARDDRHVDVTLLDYADVKSRLFGDWSMAYVRADEIDRSILKQVRGRESFDPFDMAAGEAIDLLVAIVKERKEFLARQQADSEK